MSKTTKFFTKEALDFQEKILSKAGVSDDAYFPPAVFAEPPKLDMTEARAEAEIVIFSIIEDLLARTNIKPHQIGILIVNCSLFNPTPSMTSMVCAQYRRVLMHSLRSFDLDHQSIQAVGQHIEL